MQLKEYFLKSSLGLGLIKLKGPQRLFPLQCNVNLSNPLKGLATAPNVFENNKASKIHKSFFSALWILGALKGSQGI